MVEVKATPAARRLQLAPASGSLLEMACAIAVALESSRRRAGIDLRCLVSAVLWAVVAGNHAEILFQPSVLMARVQRDFAFIEEREADGLE